MAPLTGMHRTSAFTRFWDRLIHAPRDKRLSMLGWTKSPAIGPMRDKHATYNPRASKRLRDRISRRSALPEALLADRLY